MIILNKVLSLSLIINLATHGFLNKKLKKKKKKKPNLKLNK